MKWKRHRNYDEKSINTRNAVCIRFWKSCGAQRRAQHSMCEAAQICPCLYIANKNG